MPIGADLDESPMAYHRLPEVVDRSILSTPNACGHDECFTRTRLMRSWQLSQTDLLSSGGAGRLHDHTSM